MSVKIAPSILSADFANLANEIQFITKAGADLIHFDVMDGHFVPNITFGAQLVKSVKKYSNLPFDVHLMIENPDLYIKDFADAGADFITVHAESVVHLDRTISLIKSCGAKAGVSLVPSTHENTLDYVLQDLDLVLIMTVNPGFGGQKFLANQIQKIKNIATKASKNCLISVDGGINDQTAKMVSEAGANVLVAGSFVFGKGGLDAETYRKNIDLLKNACV